MNNDLLVVQCGENSSSYASEQFFHHGDAYMDHVAISQLRYLINSEERLRGK